jgi:D-alanyl-D-alanine carboxypeptidase (penicillin-binding protein 5/6)
MDCEQKGGARTEFVTAKEMFRWAFNNFEFKSVLDISTPVAEMPVRLSSDYDYVSLYPEKQLTSILPREADNSTVIIKPTLNAESVNAPVKKGEVMGTAKVIYAEQVLGEVNLVAGQDIEGSAWLIFFDFARRIFTSVAFLVIFIVLSILAILFTLYVIYINTSDKKKKRKVKYIPYDEEKEKQRKEKLYRKRQKSGRPEYEKDERFDD